MTATTRQRFGPRWLKRAATVAVLGGQFLWCGSTAQGQTAKPTSSTSGISGGGGFNPGGGINPGGELTPGSPFNPSGGINPGGTFNPPGGFNPGGNFNPGAKFPPGVGSGPNLKPFGAPFGGFTPNPGSAIRDLLPVPPKTPALVAPLLSDDLTLVPELLLQESFGKNLSAAQWEQKLIEVFGKMRQLNKTETDGFMKALLPRRSDMAGLPIVMGDDCRMKNDQSQKFQMGLALLRSSMKKFAKDGGLDTGEKQAEQFWGTYTKVAGNAKAKVGEIGPAHIAGLMQVLAVESASMRAGLVRFLAGLQMPEATQALAKMAVFSPEEDVRQLAARALKSRANTDYTDILLAGLKHPWPAAARNAAAALVLLERTDLALQLADMLDDPDPRLPVARSVNGHETFEVKQMVKLNHNHSCIICHPPADSSTPATAVMAPMPVPGKSLATFSQGYGMSKPQPSDNDIIVRVDVTYLRQDFSLVMDVPNANPWPAKQRFDFVVRKMPLTADQAKVFQEKLQPKAGEYTPYQLALVTALRGLTGQDAGATPAAWKKALHLPS